MGLPLWCSILLLFVYGGFTALAQNWEVKTLSGASYNPSRFAISLEDHSAAFSSSAYCVDNVRGNDEPITYVRTLCDECSTCTWKKREGFTTEAEWQSAVTMEMSRLEKGGGVDNPLVQGGIAGTWIAEAPHYLRVDDGMISELGATLGVSLDGTLLVVSESRDRGYYIVSGPPSCIQGMLSVGFSSLTPIPPRLKIDPVLEETAAAAAAAEDAVLKAGGVGGTSSSSAVGVGSKEGEAQDSPAGGVHHGLYVELSKSPGHASYTNTSTTTRFDEHGPSNLLSTAWSGIMSTRLGHDRARVMADGDEHVSVRGLTSRSEVYRVALHIAQHGEVKWVSPQGRLTSSNYFANQLVQSGTWYIPEAWGSVIPDIYNPLSAIGLTGKGQVLGVADTGLDWNSCFFRDPKVTPKFKWSQAKRIKGRKNLNFETWESTKHQKIRQYIAYMNAEEDDKNGHGTHVCGSAAGGRPEHDIINRDYQGVAPDAKIAFFDTYSKTESPSLQVPANMRDLLFSPYTFAGARVFLASFNEEGKLGSAYGSMARTLDGFLYRNAKLVVLVSAGNIASDSRREIMTISKPGEAKNAVTVGSHFNPNQEFDSPPAGTIDSLLKVARHSARGPTLDGRIKPDVCGPGDSVYSAASTPRSTDPNAGPNCRGVVKSGTSSANAIVAGATVLVRQYFTDGYYPNGVKNRRDKFTPMGALLKAILVNSGRSLMSAESGLPQQLPNNEQGWGGVNLASTLVTPSSPPGLALKVYGEVYGEFDCSSGCPRVPPNKIKVFEIQTTEDTHQLPLKVTIAWYDYPAHSFSRQTLVDDIDLTVTEDENAKNPRDSVYFFSNGKSEYDTKNTVEHIEISHPKPNTKYTVRVDGSNLPQYHDTPFALVISGPFDSKRMKTKTSKNKERARPTTF